MNGRHLSCVILWALILSGCANISAPTGGKKDTRPPKLTVVSPADSQKNVRVTEITLRFDEYVTVSDASKEVIVSPIPAIPPTVTGVNKHVTVKLIDSLLEDNTTYRVSFGAAIKDLHEGNPFARYTYTFSTGSWFDSMQLAGTLVNAATGLPDTSAVIVLHKAGENDSAIVKKKPQYAMRTSHDGTFRFVGLPGRAFRIYAIKDDNGNMIYDGGAEMVAFADSILLPADSVVAPVTLRLFRELSDSVVETPPPAKANKLSGKARDRVDTLLTYTTNLDTSNVTNRTFDAADSIKLVFNKPVTLTAAAMHLVSDSAGKKTDIPFRLSVDTPGLTKTHVVAQFGQNKLYNLVVDSAFATDTSGRAAPAAAYRFRTMGVADYGKISLLIPGKYKSGGGAAAPDYLLMAETATDTIYIKKVVDTAVFFPQLKPANYTFRIIVDKNKNGKWDTGDLLAKEQPEVVVPGPQPLALKAGFDHTIDFETAPQPLKERGKLPVKKK